jgi:hypothetical protein
MKDDKITSTELNTPFTLIARYAGGLLSRNSILKNPAGPRHISVIPSGQGVNLLTNCEDIVKDSPPFLCR